MLLGKDVGDGGQAGDIQLHHRQRRVQRASRNGALQTMTGVVDQNVDRNAALAEPLMQLGDCRNIRKIDLLHDDLNAVLPAQCLGEFLQPVQPARHQHQRMALSGILAGELRAEAARGAGDENP